MRTMFLAAATEFSAASTVSDPSGREDRLVLLSDSRLCLTSARIRFLDSCGKCDSACCTRPNRVASSDEVY
jgi:hypothetical protein